MLPQNDRTPLVFIDSAVENQPTNLECDCVDCACSLVNAVEAKATAVPSATLYHSTTVSTQHLDNAYTLFYGPFHEPAVLNKMAVSLLDQFAVPRPVNPAADKDTQAAIARLQQARLLTPEGTRFTVQQTSQQLNAWLHVTDRCNLDCSYCYLPHLKHDMSLETGRQIIETLVETAVTHNYSELKLKYSGGEALLRFPLVKQLHQYAQELTQPHQIKLRGTILSNGTLLTKTIAAEMRALGISLMISLDGLGCIHDAHRPYAGGRGSFNDVQEGIAIAQNAVLNLVISITISGRNAHGLAELVRWLLTKNLRFNLNFYRENKHSDGELTFEDEQIISGMLAAYKEIEQNMPDYSLLDAIVDRANLSAPHLRTCGVGQNYMVFDHNGRVNKCQMHLYDGPPNQTTSQPLTWVQTAPEGIQNLSVEDKDECSSCEWKYWCAGGCPLVTWQATGTFNKRSPNCAIYKAIYPEAMRLEGLRLLQLHADQGMVL
ncbi:MAG: radical SAM protein [Chloroflexi bacterium]|nr:radical SAM protein [Chloroflexota bacterium]